MERLDVKTWRAIQHARKAFGARLLPSEDYARWLAARADAKPDDLTFLVLEGEDFLAWLEKEDEAEQLGVNRWRWGPMTFQFAESVEQYLRDYPNPAILDPMGRTYAEAKDMRGIAGDTYPVGYKVDGKFFGYAECPVDQTPVERQGTITKHYTSLAKHLGVVQLTTRYDQWFVIIKGAANVDGVSTGTGECGFTHWRDDDNGPCPPGPSDVPLPPLSLYEQTDAIYDGSGPADGVPEVFGDGTPDYTTPTAHGPGPGGNGDGYRERPGDAGPPGDDPKPLRGPRGRYAGDEDWPEDHGGESG